jgi:hypothetical protein
MTVADDMYLSELGATSFLGCAYSICTHTRTTSELFGHEHFCVESWREAAGCVAYSTHAHTAVLLVEHVVSCYCRRSTSSDDIQSFSALLQQSLVCSPCLRASQLSGRNVKHCRAF